MSYSAQPNESRFAFRVATLIAIVAAPQAAMGAVRISDGTTQYMQCQSGTCQPTAKNAVMNINDLANLLGQGDVELTTGSYGGAISFETIFGWYQTTRLTLDAGSVVIDAPVSLGGTGGLTVNTKKKTRDSRLSFGAAGYLKFWDTGSTLIIGGHQYTLLKDVPSLAAAAKDNPAGYYALAASYDAKELGVLHDAPVKKSFTGVFEGLGNTISNLSIHTKKQNKTLGLFATSSGVISNLRLAHASVFAGDGSQIGAIVGTNSGLLSGDSADGNIGETVQNEGGAEIGLVAGANSGVISGSSSSGTAKAGFYGYVAGLVGNNTGSIGSSHSSASVTGGASGYPGGLVSLNSGTIAHSSATGNVQPSPGASTISGGLASDSYGAGVITDSYSTGAVTTGEFGMAGGLIGGNQGSVSRCYSTSASSDGDSGGDAYVGGLIGYNTGTVADTFAEGAVTEYSGSIGGLVGQNDGTVAKSYSTGRVTSQSVPYGGFAGTDRGSISNGYWDTDTSGVANSHQGAGEPLDDPGITGLTTKQLRSALPAGFSPDVWAEKKVLNGGLPYLISLLPRRH